MKCVSKQDITYALPVKVSNAPPLFINHLLNVFSSTVKSKNVIKSVITQP